MRTIRIRATWDPEARVWVAESDDIALVTEAPTSDALIAKLPGLIQDLLEDETDGKDEVVPFELISQSTVRVRARAA
jgi:hypothetical protein